MPIPERSGPNSVTRRELLVSAAATLIGGLCPLVAQQAVFQADVRVVNLLATVRDRNGRFVTDLKQEDFELREDGRLQVIRYFAWQPDLPLTLGLLVDTSLSQTRLIEAERRAANRFLETVLREGTDAAFVIQFHREAELLQDLSCSKKELLAALEKLTGPVRPQLQRKQAAPFGSLFQWPGDTQWPGRTPFPVPGRTPPGGRRPRGGPAPGPDGRAPRMAGVGTVLYDAVFLAAEEILQRQSGRKAAIVISDGVDAGSKVTLERALEAVQRADAVCYTIRFHDEQAYQRLRRISGAGGRNRLELPDGKKVLERLARSTGGAMQEVSDKLNLEDVFSNIEQELRNQYSLGYVSDRPEGHGEFRTISLTVKRKGLTAFTRNGYYAHSG